MKGSRFLLAIGLIAGLAGTAVAQPQHLDHLKCYKIKDPANFSASVTLEALQTQFGLEQCTMKGKGKFFCVPVDKTVTAYKDKTKPPLNGMSLVSQKLAEDRICYRLKCPKVAIPTIGVSDQFGTRDIGRFVPIMLCTPARKAVIDPPDDCLGTAPECNGACPNSDEICRPVGPPPALNCTCQPPPHDLCPDTAPTCNGDCPVAVGAPPEVCRPSPDGTTSCTCQRPPTACSDTAPQCNGDCPAGSKCLRTATGCDCFDPNACHSVAGTTICNGSCQIPGQVCQADALVGCRCGFPSQ
jgi:hypothetical protein